MQTGEFLLVGKVMRARGLRGELLVRLFNAESGLLEPGREITLKGEKITERRCVVRHARDLNRGWGILLEGVADRTAAEALHGAELWVRWGELPELADDEFYYEELRGFTAELPDGTRVGEVAGVFETNVDNLVVRDGDREHLIPVLDGFVTEIDRQRRVVVVDPPAGLLEL